MGCLSVKLIDLFLTPRWQPSLQIQNFHEVGNSNHIELIYVILLPFREPIVVSWSLLGWKGPTCLLPLPNRGEFSVLWRCAFEINRWPLIIINISAHCPRFENRLVGSVPNPTGEDDEVAATRRPLSTIPIDWDSLSHHYTPARFVKAYHSPSLSHVECGYNYYPDQWCKAIHDVTVLISLKVKRHFWWRLTNYSL